jgi:hypothetical protein
MEPQGTRVAWVGRRPGSLKEAEVYLDRSGGWAGGRGFKSGRGFGKKPQIRREPRWARSLRVVSRGPSADVDPGAAHGHGRHSITSG